MTALSSRHDLEQARVRVAPFVLAHGFDGHFELEPLPGGANNRVYCVQGTDHRAVLKSYFQHPADPRDRFAAERAFYTFCWNAGVRQVAQPLAWDGERRLGLMEFISGRKVKPEEIQRELVEQAEQFVAGLNQARTSAAALALPVASEACFSVSEHLATVERRVARLQEINTHSEIDDQAADFVQTKLKSAWGRVRRSVTAAVGPLPGGLEGQLRSEARCLSPSDFGFHNALLAPDGRLRFFDFEYAGWDDPAKLLCDFFCQPQLPVDIKHWDFFAKCVARWAGLSSLEIVRARMLLPAYQIKWCCIVLNEFLRVDQARRDFAQGDVTARKRAQLDKAQRLLSSTDSAEQES